MLVLLRMPTHSSTLSASPQRSHNGVRQQQKKNKHSFAFPQRKVVLIWEKISDWPPSSGGQSTVPGHLQLELYRSMATTSGKGC